MKFAFIVHMYPFKNMGLSGGELYAHRMIKNIKKYNIEVDVYNLITSWTECTKDRPPEWVYDEVNVKIISHTKEIPDNYDAYFCHLATTEQTIKYCDYINKHCFFISHNISNYEFINKVLEDDTKLSIIYNSNYVKNITPYKFNGFVYTPPLDFKYWYNEKDTYYNDYITLVNPIPDKGSLIFKRLTELLPHRKFLVVKGGYSTNQQILNFNKNVTIMDPQTDMKEVYKQTRILLYMSYHESWGMCASEAQSYGIPVISYHCPETIGLSENMKISGVYVYDNILDYVQWIDKINMLDDYYTYTKISLMGQQQQELNSQDHINDKFVNWLMETLKK